MVELLIGILAVLVILYIFKYRRNGAKMPPGPFCLPVFGYYFSLVKNPMIKLHELGKKYGNVFSLYIGPQYVVVLDDWEATKEALNKSSTLDRPAKLFDHIPYRLGIAGTNGPAWFETRRITSRAIKEIGLHRVGWEDLLQEETLDLVQQIAEKNGQPVDVCSFFAQSFINNVVSLILGERFQRGHPLRGQFADAVNAIMEFTPTLGMANFSPALSRFLQAAGLEKENRLAEYVEGLAKYVSDTVDDRLRNPATAADEDSFIGRFQEEIENHKKDRISYITEDSMKGNSISLLTGGGETTRTTIIWTLVAMADHPEIQRRVHQELDSTIGKEGVVKWGEQSKVPYTYAALLESMRWKTVIPLVSRSATEDLEVQGYRILKGTPIVFNNWSIHNDTRYWDSPELFVPERFLLEEGRKVNSSPESFNPFSFGKRNCPGKMLALKALFLIFTLLMQKFQVLPESGQKVEHDTLLGLSYQARNVKLRFIPR